ncbi:hypothetical protein L596_025916 [Steinernema carpocapsae]|uniref:Uncharacterized protein n=1 Tax=Steinernema carpocapsae TaxID=34508 RepID=A0A4V5ZYY8_STECR|nr:hypothetical protein L596_025916 [Steinernema carpocapsae]
MPINQTHYPSSPMLCDADAHSVYICVWATEQSGVAVAVKEAAVARKQGSGGHTTHNNYPRNRRRRDRRDV